jgi:hypothetical protein
MSVIDERSNKVLLPRQGVDAFWRAVMEHYAGRDRRRWKYLAMLALQECADWPLECIGLVFGHPRGHVSRCLARVTDDLRDRFQPEPAQQDAQERAEDTPDAPDDAKR